MRRVHLRPRAERPGLQPATVNAETTLLFDLVPEQPGCDIAAPSGTIDVAARVSHHGPEALTCRLTWSWEGGQVELGQRLLVVRPFVLTDPVPIRCALPDAAAGARLTPGDRRAGGECRAAAFLDVERDAGRLVSAAHPRHRRRKHWEVNCS